MRTLAIKQLRWPSGSFIGWLNLLLVIGQSETFKLYLVEFSATSLNNTVIYKVKHIQSKRRIKPEATMTTFHMI